MHTGRFAEILWTLEPALPISTALERAQPQRRGAWWRNQRDHMGTWFEQQRTLGSGAYSREAPNLSARRTWNRLLHAAGMIWIAEALGAPADRVQAAADAALREPDVRRRCAAVREVLPWDLIYQLAVTRQPPRRSRVNRHQGATNLRRNSRNPRR